MDSYAFEFWVDGDARFSLLERRRDELPAVSKAGFRRQSWQ